MLRYNLLYVKVISIIVTIKNTTKKNKFSFKHNTFQNWKTEEIYMWKNEVKWQWKINRYISKHDFSCQIEIYHSICLKTSGGGGSEDSLSNPSVYDFTWYHIILDRLRIVITDNNSFNKNESRWIWWFYLSGMYIWQNDFSLEPKKWNKKKIKFLNVWFIT